MKADDRIEAEVLLRQPKPVAGTKTTTRAQSAGQRAPDSETVEKVANRLRALGFEVLAQSPVSVSIAGTRALFTRVLKMSDAPDEISHDLIVPGDLEDYVEGVYVQVPPTYF